ncbi:hypothetical protein HC256_007696 [Beauveria bassiana]|nr:hypothetical protein HC256_007696 [Beauveria bassiana]
MTNHRHGPSLLQARDSHSVDSLPSSASDSHTRSAIHLQAHRHTHYPHTHDHIRHRDTSDDNNHGNQHHQQSHSHSAASPATESIVAQSDLDDRVSSDSRSLEARSPAAAVDAALAARADDATSYVTQVVQTISIVQVVDYSGSPISSSTQYATPNTVVVDPSTGETKSQSSPGFTIAVNPSSLVPGLGSSYTTPSTTTSTHHTTSTSSQPSSAPLPSLSASSFPTLSDPSNGTAWGNATVLSSAHNSTIAPTTISQSSAVNYNTSTTQSNFRILSSSSETNTLSSSSSSSSSSASTSISSSSSLSSSYSSTYSSTPAWNSPTVVPTVEGSAETSSAASSSGSYPMTTQQKQIVGSVLGSVAGVAFLALLVLLAMRYKNKRNAESRSINRGSPGFAALPASGSDAANSMTERNGAAASVNAAFAAFASKRQSRGAPDALEVPSGERGFHRVSGRKLQSVLYTGGDGYSDPRESTLSQYSQSSEPFNPGDEPFALGSPMRPVSGVPIFRSGPARTPVTEANPFADPAMSPPMAKNNSPPRRPGSSGSARGSSSRFQESI